MDLDLTLDESLSVLHERRMGVLKQRKGLEINHRIQKKLGAGPDALRAIEEDLRRCEIALDELAEIEKEWRTGALSN